MRWYKLDAHGDGGIRLAGKGVEQTTCAGEADWLVVAECLFSLFRDKERWERIWNDPMIVTCPERVVAYDCSDDGCRFGTPGGDAHWPRPPMPGIRYFRCGLTAMQQADYPSAISWPWPSPDLSVWQSHFPDAPTQPTSFIGWKTPRPETTLAVESCRRVFGDSVDLRIREGFFGHRHPRAGVHDPDNPPDDPTVAQEEADYRQNLFAGMTALCPQSIQGVLRYRVTEAMSIARVPVIVGDQHILPFADRIPWSSYTIQVDPEEVGQTGEILRRTLDAWGPVETSVRGRLAAAAYRRWLHKDRFPELMAEVLQS